MNIYEVEPEDQDDERVVPNYEEEHVSAKAFLQKSSPETGENLYDHLTEVLNKILAERPENVIDFFEEYSRKVKEKRFRPMTDHLEDIYIPPQQYEMAKKLMTLLKPSISEGRSTKDPEDTDLPDMSKNNMLHLLHFFEQAGIGLPRLEVFAIMLSMNELVKNEPIASIRFWGKIYGTVKNYIIVETQLKEEEYMRRNEVVNEATAHALEEKQFQEIQKTQQIQEKLDDITHQQEIGGEEDTKNQKVRRPLPPEPPVQYEVPPEPPNEPSGVGVNKKVYYVCNDVGEEWIQLPDVTPKQIRVARQIYKSLTGYLDHPLITYPEFPGCEINYLRAQIARISAATQISPLGYYTFGAGEVGGEGEEEEDEEKPGGTDKTSYTENPKYDPPTLRDLIDGSLAFWVHHSQYILPQGRTSWWNPNPLPDVDEDEELGEAEEEPGDKPKMAGPEPETGPTLLIPLSEDASLEAIPPWSVRPSSTLMQDHALAIVRSNLWPGAYCFATQGKLFENAYLGYGLKFNSNNFSPVPLPPVQQEYQLGPEIMEIMDPTGADEEAWRIAHLPKPKPPPIALGEGEGEEEEEDEEEEDDEED